MSLFPPVRPRFLSLLWPALLLVVSLSVSGCILFEDPAEVEGTDVMLPDVNDTGFDFGDLPEDLMDCADNNPFSCGTSCTDCSALTAISDVACVAGVCMIEACQDGFANCDGQPANGCEQAESNRACGAMCDNCLDRPQSLGGACTMGMCELDCEVGFYNCDGNLQNGCERMESEQSCGASCLDCAALPNVDRATCTAGTCLISECRWGFLDCNGDPVDGCEAPASDSLCGPGCNLDCNALAGVSAARCAGSRCGIVECAPNRQDANNDWLDGCEKECRLGECWINSPQAFRTTAFLGSDGIGLAGSDNGVIYYTEDDGVSWSAISTPLSDTVRAIAFNGVAVAVAIANDGEVVRSIDRGLTWETVLLPAGAGTPLNVAGDGNRFVLVGTGTMLLSDDRGRSFINASSRIDNADLRAAYISGDLLLVGGASGRLLRSDDGGETVTAVSEPTTATIRFFATSGARVVAGGNAFLAESADNGLTWTAVQGTPDPQLNWTGMASDGELSVLIAGAQFAYRAAAADAFATVDVVEGDTLVGASLVGTEARLIANIGNFGHVYETVANDGMGMPTYQRLDLTHADNDLRFVTDVGTDMITGGGAGGQLFRSTDDGVSWTPVGAGLIGESLRHDSIPDGQNGIIAANVVNVIRTTDGGANWEVTLPGAVDYVFRDAAYESTGAFAVVAGERSGGPALFIGLPSGMSVMWQVRNCTGTPQCPAVSTFRSLAIGSATSAVAASADGTVLKTTDLGGTWASVLNVGANIIDVDYEGTEIRALTGSTIWRSTDDGATWPDAMGPTPVFDGSGLMPPVTMSNWAFEGSFGIAVGNGGWVVLSADGGETWNPIDTGIAVNFTHAVVSNSTFVAIANDGTVGFSTDGTNWESTTIDLRGQTVRDVRVDNGRISLVAANGQVVFSYGP